jgi:pimeloyl-ACP methyl ester carboxylesterase
MRERGWVRSLITVADPTVRVVCFPHSGGSAAAFGDWATAMPPGVELVAVQYPGRGDRFVEPLVDDVAAMADHAAAELRRLPTSDHVLFGHSLGALVAYETAMVLRDMGAEPSRLCASACLPPGQMANRHVHRAPDDEFWAALCRLGGIEPWIAENAELRELLSPALGPPGTRDLPSPFRGRATVVPGALLPRRRRSTGGRDAADGVGWCHHGRVHLAGAHWRALPPGRRGRRVDLGRPWSAPGVSDSTPGVAGHLLDVAVQSLIAKPG